MSLKKAARLCAIERSSRFKKHSISTNAARGALPSARPSGLSKPQQEGQRHKDTNEFRGSRDGEGRLVADGDSVAGGHRLADDPPGHRAQNESEASGGVERSESGGSDLWRSEIGRHHHRRNESVNVSA